MGNVHYVEIIPRPHWRRFLRRDALGRVADYPPEARIANAHLAARNDGALKRLARLGDVKAYRRRLAHLGIEVSTAHAEQLMRGAL